ncbi:MAG TPA: tetratricopeptide repeat protein [Marinagarivorans sp.]
MSKKALTLGLSIAALALCAAGCKEKRTAQDYLHSAEQFHAQKMYGKARVEYRNALALESSNADAHAGLAQLAKEKDDPAAQYFHLQKAAEFDPARADIQYQLGEVAILMGELTTAQAAEMRLRELEPASENRYRLSLAVFIAQREWSQAASLAREALEAFPESADIWGLTGVAAKKQSQWSRALEALNYAIELEGEDSQYRLLRIEVNQAQGDILAAIEDLKILLSGGQYTDAQIIKLIKMVNDHSGREAAIAELKSYIKKFPDADALQVLLVDLVKQDNPGKAGELLQQFILQAKNPTGLLFYRVNAALSNSNVVLAEQDLRQLLEVPDQSEKALAQAHAMLADIAWLKGDVAQAKEQLNAAFASGDASAKALLLKAKIALSEGRETDAVGYLNKCLAKNASDVSALVLLGQIYQQQGKAGIAADFYQRVLRQDPYNYPALRFQIAEAYDKQHFTNADALLTRALEQYPDDAALISIKLQVAAQRGNHQEAYALLDALQHAHSDSADVAYLKGFILQQQGQHADAIKAFAEAVSLRGHYAKALNAMRASSEKANDWRLLGDFLKNHIQKYPDDLDAQLLFAQLTINNAALRGAQLDADDVARAERQILAVLERHANWVDGIIWLASLRRAQGDEQGAQSVLRRFYQQHPDASNVGIAYARALEQAGAFADAGRLYEQVLKRDSGDLIARNNYALLLVGALKSDGAVRKALQLTQGFDDSKSPALLDTRGVVLTEAEQYSQAHYAFDRALRLADIVAIRLHYAASLMQAGKSEQANAMLDKLAKDYQSDAEVLRNIAEIKARERTQNED